MWSSSRGHQVMYSLRSSTLQAPKTLTGLLDNALGHLSDWQLFVASPETAMSGTYDDSMIDVSSDSFWEGGPFS
ncbi:hypothetical protein Z043_115123 [Scleropages formosus]|uniref:Uncharacterized protein n=1 Tax=Scleropages formosus TaxID=113540 RepID=A0A0P7V270_SCLFO|nr:hypothetical protein Z043_115123 [Scleropages formosus]